jgi:sRNA-binding carbon storage regulator CsrA
MRKKMYGTGFEKKAGVLVLARNVEEAVIITAPDGSTVALWPVRIDEGSVRLAFRADPAVVINRAEVQEEIDAGKGGGGG